jgi:DNA helicase-2/ATP-dependent DNA helicase PcrA
VEPDFLNPEQRAAVDHGDGPLMVLAGAGTGKTRVLVQRIARLVETGAEPWAIHGVTVTHKAAGEMRHRLRGSSVRGRTRCGSARSTPRVRGCFAGTACTSA